MLPTISFSYKIAHDKGNHVLWYLCTTIRTFLNLYYGIKREVLFINTCDNVYLLLKNPTTNMQNSIHSIENIF